MTIRAPRARAHWHDAYDAQMSLWRWYRTDLGVEFLARSYREASDGMSDSTSEMMLDMHQAERNRLLDLDPIYVSKEMCEVVEAASDTFQPEPLLETDLITPRGFLFYEHPFLVPDRFERPTWIKAISWIRVFNSGTQTREEYEALLETIALIHEGGVNPGDIEEVERNAMAAGAYPWGIHLTLYTEAALESLKHPALFPAVIPLHLTPWYFGMEFRGNEVDELGVQTGAAWWWRIVQTTFRLMQQRIAHKGFQRPDRAARRDAKAIGFPPEREIVVVRLRREQGERSEPTGEPANYSHRFIVGAHWRNQWYPSQGIHRQIWIDAFVKGPEDLPLIVRPRRVYQWEK